MTSAMAVRGPVLHLPWTTDAEDDKNFYRFLLVGLALLLLCGIAIPLITLPEVSREEAEEIPPQLARLVLEKKELPPPPPPPEVEKKQPEPEKPKPEPKPQPRPEPQPIPEPVQTVEEARDVAAVSGLLQFKDDLEEMRDSVDKDALSNNELSRAQGEARQTERAIITGKVGETSGGINTASLSRDTGGAALSGRETTRVAGVPGGTRKGRTSGSRPGAGAGAGAGSGRSDESVRIVFDRNKGAIFSIYNRALRKNPALQGKVTVRLVIEPSGAVSSCTVVSSELGDPALESKLVSRIKLINFGAEPVAQTTVNYSFDFLPF